MKEALIYFLQANLCLVIFYLAYHLGLRKYGQYQYLRFFLLSSLLLSLALPFVSSFSQGTNTLIEIDLQEILVYQLRGNTIGIEEYSISTMLKQVYIIGAAIALLLFIYRLASISLLIYKGEKHVRNGYTLVRSVKDVPTFSFFRYLVISKTNPEPINEIIIHEKAHIDQAHSVDMLFVELMKVVFWFNPALYFYSNSLKEVHEYQADAEVVRQVGQPQDYIKVILGETFGVEGETLVNTFFNSSLLAKRISAIHFNSIVARKFKWFHWVIILFTMAFAVKTSFTLAEPNWVRDSKNVFTRVDVMPEYPGGMNELMAFIGSQVTYPQELINQDVQGTVYVKFVISKTGKVGQVKVIKGVHPILDEEALKAVANMPNWQPGQNNGSNVAVTYTLPIKFAL